MSGVDERLIHLADLYGISTEFWDWKGHHHDTPEETIIACLKAFDVDTTCEGWVEFAIEALDERPWKQPVPLCTVIEQNQDAIVNVHVHAGRPAHLWIRCEDGTTFSLHQCESSEPDRLVDGEWIGRSCFQIPSGMAPGYHTMFLESDGQTWEAPLMVTPSWLGVPQVGHGSMWGFMTQLYSLDSLASWGLGDFGDLRDLVVWAKAIHGAQYVLINPTHAAQVIAPMEPSPYLPSTRRFLNPVYIRPEAVEEYTRVASDIRAQIDAMREKCRHDVLAEEHLDRDTVWAAKMAALRLIFDGGRSAARDIEMNAYYAHEGKALRSFATWCVLTQTYGQEWKDWPEPYKDPESREVETFAGSHQKDIGFHMWMQWIADEQARRAQHTATDGGMRIGVMADLAVGIDKEGEETWSLRDVFARGVTVGAPPDAYNQAGQNWQQPPWRPDRLKETAYAPLRDMVRGILSRCGGLRVDHIIGLFRMWWIPDGLGPEMGAYVRYNHEAMVGILALEAARAGAVIVGEDLGTVEPWARDYLARRGILGTSILWFENGDDGKPLHPEQWRELCMGSVTTHDLPPTLGYLAHDHVQLRYQLGLLTESLEDEIDHDAKEQGAMLHVLVERGLLKEGVDDPHEVVLALHRFLYQTPSKLKVVALTDAVGERRTQNQPGTIDEYPNWRIPLGDETGRRLTLEEIFTMESVGKLANIMNGTV